MGQGAAGAAEEYRLEMGWQDRNEPKSLRMDAQICTVIQQHSCQDPRIRKGEVTAKDVLAIVQELWERTRPGQACPDTCMQAVGHMLSR